MEKLRRTPFLQTLIQQSVARAGGVVIFADQFGYAGCIEFDNGRRSFFRGTSFDINPQGASRIASDKDFAAKFLAKFGYKVPEGMLVFAPEYREKLEKRNSDLADHLPGVAAAHAFAERHGYPLFVKPNEESEGRGVARVYDARQLSEHVTSLFARHERVLVQRPVIGEDFRIVVLDDQVISAYQRVPLRIAGDGRSTIEHLIGRKIAGLRASGRGFKIEVADPRFEREVRQQGFALEQVPPAETVITLLPNANLSTGGDAVDLTETIHPSYGAYCVGVARAMGLVMCGVDLIAPSITAPLSDPTVLEINSAPGLNNFATVGVKAESAVQALYDQLVMRLKSGNRGGA